jgi:hypothetical protein
MSNKQIENIQLMLRKAETFKDTKEIAKNYQHIIFNHISNLLEKYQLEYYKIFEDESIDEYEFKKLVYELNLKKIELYKLEILIYEKGIPLNTNIYVPFNEGTYKHLKQKCEKEEEENNSLFLY